MIIVTFWFNKCANIFLFIQMKTNKLILKIDKKYILSLKNILQNFSLTKLKQNLQLFLINQL